MKSAAGKTTVGPPILAVMNPMVVYEWMTAQEGLSRALVVEVERGCGRAEK